MHYVKLGELNAFYFKTFASITVIMDANIFSKVVLESARSLSAIAEIKTKRDIYTRMSSPTDYFVGIKGLRGIGKTTSILQMAQNYKNPLYFSADAIYLMNSTIYDVINHAQKNGYDSFFVDEIHYQKDWTYSLKTLYDEGIRNLFFTGSSAIELDKGADLSRRAVLFDLPPATFSEFLRIKHGIDLPSLSLEDILKKKKDLLPKYSDTYQYFGEYLAYGGVLYDRKEFDLKLLNSINKLISVDMGYLRDININVETNILKIFQLIATTSSFEVNYSKLSSALGISKVTVERLVSDLEKAGSLSVCRPCRRGYALVRNEPKIFLPFPLASFFCRQIGAEPKIGRLREEFFISHVDKPCYVKTARGEKTSDFRLGDIIFEIGGVSKTSIQNPDYIVVDGLDCLENRIPLILFGFLQYVQ